MKIQKYLAIATATACVIAIAPWIFTFGWQPLSSMPTNWGVFGDYIGGVLSAPLAFAGLVALLATIQQQQAFAQAEQNKSNNLRYFEGAVKCLERAYSTFHPLGVDAPKKDRLVWLTTARWLLAARDLSRQISSTSPALKTAYGVEEEHFRMLFYGFLDPTAVSGVFSVKEFFEGNFTREGAEIEERSARVILDFIEWPEGKVDAIDQVPLYTAAEVEAMNISLRGFKAFLHEKKRFQAERDQPN